MAGLVAAYLFTAYLILPLLWREHEERHHPALDAAPGVTTNAQGIPGDPINVALVGSRSKLVGAMLAAGWRPADPITLHTTLDIGKSVLLDRPDPDAPVSSLYLLGRKQDLAFEREVGSSADRRHHVRWWKSDQPDEQGRPLWLGAASFDVGSGLSHRTGQITHHIAPDIDAERNALIADLANAGQLDGQYDWPGVGPTRDGRNAGGDRYETDGFIIIGVLKLTDAGGSSAVTHSFDSSVTADRVEILPLPAGGEAHDHLITTDRPARASPRREDRRSLGNHACLLALAFRPLNRPPCSQVRGIPGRGTP